MALLLPCKDEISAHLLRSRLLSHDIECAVVHGGIATIWGGWVMRPRLLLAADDFERAQSLCGESEEAIDETFVEPAETAVLNENRGFESTVPTFLSMLLVGCVIGFAGGVLLLLGITVVTMAKGGISRELSTAESSIVYVPFLMAGGGLLFGAVVWPLPLLALLGEACSM